MTEHRGLGAREFEIMATLAAGPKHGYGIMTELRTTGMGNRVLGPGTLYRVLKALVERGLIVDAMIEESAEGPPRRYYRLTASGRRVVAAEVERLRSLLQRIEPLLEGEFR